MLCGATVFRPWLTRCPDNYLQKGCLVNYVECKACLLVQQHPLPDDVGALYTDYPVHSSRNLMQRLARRIFHRQVYYRPPACSADLSLLDYGCGDGTFLCEMKGRFKSLYGFEPGCSHAEKLSALLDVPIFSSTENLRQELAGKIDLITAHFVLEHVSDFQEAFQTFQTLLKLGGTLYVAVPNIRSWEINLFKKFWHGLDAPRHLAFPDPVHFKMLTDRYGFNIGGTSFAAFPNTLAGSLATVLSGRCHPLLFMGLILPCWLVSLCAPQGTLIIQMVKA
jgi:SAM-dependent methyltransferase